MPMPVMTSPEATIEDGAMLLVVLHEHAGGYSTYPVIVPGSYEIPAGTLGGEEHVEDHPELWSKYKKLVDLLEIDFDTNRSDEFLSISVNRANTVPVATLDELS